MEEKIEGKKETLHCDLAIIGAGAGGLSLAAGAAQLGVKVVLVERGLMGGDCLNYGCVPSKSLLAVAKHYWRAHHSQELGTIIHQSALDFKNVMQHVHQTIKTLAVHDSIERFEKLGVQVIQANGQFIDKTTLSVGNYLVHAKHIVIATGSSPAIPPIPGLDQITYYTNETIFNLEILPHHLLVVGGGPIGCELAQAFAMLGTQVTLFEAATILTHDEPDCVQIVRESLQTTGVTIIENAQVRQVSSSHTSIMLQVEKDGKTSQFNGSHLLIATGRIPNIEGLNCEKAGIRYDKKSIIVNKRLRTSNKKVYALGDVAGHLQFTHVANYHASLLLRTILFKLPVKVDPLAVPWVTYTNPELAHVGKTERQCHEMSIDYTTLKVAYADNDRAQTENETQGLIKVLSNKNGQILGVSIVGHLAGELIAPWVTAIRENKTLRSFTDTIVAYPTFNELSKQAAGQFYAPKLFSAKVKMLVKFLSYF